MNWLQNYAIIILPLLAGSITQILKLITDKIRGNFTWHDLVTSYGGMPSSHTAFVVSLTTILGLKIGLTDPIFGVSVILTFIVIRDAMGFRTILGDQNKVLNKLVNSLSPAQKNGLPPLKERIAHTLPEIIVGSLCGIIISLIYYWIIF